MKQTTNFRWSFFSGFIKRFADVVASLIGLVLLFPFLFFLSLILVFTSGWPIIYTQQRMGKNKRPFQIYKFRTMKLDAEEDGPQLSHEDDERVVGLGRILRKWRLDELPQLFNVLKGDMSIIGPRPERKFYVDQLDKRVPNYSIIFNVRPGITSSGMVNYGYASTIDEMEVRAPFDIEYVKHLSLSNDLTILLKTVQVVLEGSGK